MTTRTKKTKMAGYSIYEPGTLAMSPSLLSHLPPVFLYRTSDPRAPHREGFNPYSEEALSLNLKYDACEVPPGQILMVVKCETRTGNIGHERKTAAYLQLLTGDRVGWWAVSRDTWKKMVEAFQASNTEQQREYE